MLVILPISPLVIGCVVGVMDAAKGLFRRAWAFPFASVNFLRDRWPIVRPIKSASAALAVMVVLSGHIAWSQTSQPIRIVIPFPAGGAADIVIRSVAEELGRSHGISTVIENRPGGGTVIATEAVARAAPDGNTLLINANSFVINPSLRKLTYDPLTSFEPICYLVDTPMFIVVGSASPYRTLGELLAAARAQPGQLNLGSLGPATAQHIAFELLKRRADINMTFVPFPGNVQAISALLGGHLTSSLANYPDIIGQLRAGTLRALATTAATRVEQLPDVPTVAGLGFDNFAASVWIGLVAPGHVRALVERPSETNLIAAAQAVLSREDPSPHIIRYNDVERNKADGLIVEPTFGAIPIGRGANYAAPEDPRVFLEPGKSEKFLVNGFVEARGRDGVPGYIDEKHEFPIHSNPSVGELLAPPPCLPTCGTSTYVGDAETVRQMLDVQTLKDNGFDGSGVAIAIVDSGIYRPRIERLLGEAMKPIPTPVDLDELNSWQPGDLVTKPGYHRLGHGTMCAYDALIAAPMATLLDIPMLLARKVADHRVKGTVDAAIQAYVHLINVWLLGPRSFDALVVSNSWGIFHPCLEDYQPGHPFRFIDNPNHIFRHMIRGLSSAGVDVVFCGNNCGDGRNCAGDCASGTCLSKTDRMIMGANSYQDVLTIGGCDTKDEIVGYSSRGPSILKMYQNKPDLVAYTHFLGSKTSRMWVPDTGVSAACPVAAGCVAALRTKVKPTTTKPSVLFQALRDTAYKPAGVPPGWDPAFGHGVIRPVAAARSLGLI